MKCFLGSMAGSIFGIIAMCLVFHFFCPMAKNHGCNGCKCDNAAKTCGCCDGCKCGECHCGQAGFLDKCCGDCKCAAKCHCNADCKCVDCKCCKDKKCGANCKCEHCAKCPK
jgi:hypothetical protein